MTLVLNSDIFGKNLYFLRKKHRTSTAKLAEEFSIPPIIIRCIETGTIMEVDSNFFAGVCCKYGIDYMTMLDVDLQAIPEHAP